VSGPGDGDDRPKTNERTFDEMQLAEPYQPQTEQQAPQTAELGERLGQEMGYRPDAAQQAEKQEPFQRQPNVYAIRPEAPKGSIVWKLVIAGLVACAAFGGYYGYCHYQAVNKIWEFDQQAREIHNDLMLLGRNIDPPDITETVLKMAAEAEVEATAGDIRSTIEPYNSTTEHKLPVVQAQGIKVAKSMVPVSGDVWVVGFSGRFRAKHGIVKKWFTHQRHTYFQIVDIRKYPLPDKDPDAWKKRIPKLHP
jgi:hypothetical protein